MRPRFYMSALLFCMMLIENVSLANNQDSLDQSAIAADANAAAAPAPDIEPEAIGRRNRCCIVKTNGDDAIYCRTLHMTKIRANSVCQRLQYQYSGADFVVRGGTCEGSWFDRCFVRGSTPLPPDSF